jgi:MFS family permease
MPASDPSQVSARIAFAYPNFTLLQLSRFLIILAMETQSVAVGWQVYEITKQPLALGLAGLAQFLPGILLFLVAGHAADRYDRRNLLVMCDVGFTACFALLLFITLRGPHTVRPIYGALILLGVFRSFSGPVSRAIFPQLVPQEHFQNAVAWSSSVYQSANILGPALGGMIYAIFRGPAAVYTFALVAGASASIAALQIKTPSKTWTPQPYSATAVFSGFPYIWKQKPIRGSISLDLFAVFLGGATALLPVYAREILKTGPWGLGLLRTAPGVGAAVMAVFLAHKPLRKRAGAIMLWCVAGFGIFTIVFGISRNIVLSFVALLLVGAMDMVSVIIRATLIQIATPDEMRGRVNAVDMVFIGASNEFGEFESGLTAHWFGTVPAVVLGGIGTLVVTAIWAWRFPELRKTDNLARTQDDKP